VPIAFAGHGSPVQLGFHPSAFNIVLTVVVVAIGIWALIDAARMPSSSWAAVGRSKVRWIVALVVLTILSPLGLIPAVWYFASVRRQVMQQRRRP
jgi:hypothetical protein